MPTLALPTDRPIQIAIDVDEVCLQLMPAWLARYTARSGHVLSPGDITGWNVIPHLSGTWVAPFFAILDEDDLYDRVPALAGAAAGLALLRASGAHLTFVTAGALGSLESKLRRMRTLGLLEPADHLVVAVDKTRTVCADAFVDDRAETILAALAAGRHGVLVAQPWNAWAVDDVRAAGGHRRLRLDDDRGSAPSRAGAAHLSPHPVRRVLHSASESPRESTHESASASALGPRSILGWFQGTGDDPAAVSMDTPVLALRDLPTGTTVDRELHVEVEIPHPFDRRRTVWIVARQDALVPHLGSVAVWRPATSSLVM